MSIPIRKKKRYFCTYVKLNDNKEFKGDVVVVEAFNETLARLTLCEKYNVPPNPPQTNNLGDYMSEGVKSVRLAETNVYEGGSVHDNFSDD